MAANRRSESSIQEEEMREALDAHRQASAAGDADVEHEIYDDAAICDYPQFRRTNSRPS